MIESIRHDDILELRLARPPVNALNPGLMTQLRDAITAAPGEDARGLVISGGPNVLSAGLDVPHLMSLERDDLEAAWREFFGVLEALARSPLPSVAAIGGHSPAGGAVMGLFCDYRVMARGPFRIGLNEVQVGLIVPECIQYALRRLVGTYRAERLLVAGAMVPAEQAAQIGLVDELSARENVAERPPAWLAALLALPPQAMLQTRAIARADVIAAMQPELIQLPRFIEAWYAPFTQKALQALVARLGK